MCLSRPRTDRIHARHPLSSGRADNACTNLLGYFVRYVRTRGSMRLRGTRHRRLAPFPRAARTCHAWLARLTRARRTEVWKEDGVSPPC